MESLQKEIEANIDSSLVAALESLRLALEVTRVTIFRLLSFNDTYRLKRICKIQRIPSLSMVRDEIDIQKESMASLAKLFDGNVFVGHSDQLEGEVRILFEEHRIRSFMIAPIVIRDERWGFLTVVDCAQKRRFSNHEKAIFWALARTVGESLKRQQMFLQLQQMKKEMEQLNATLQLKIEEEVRKNREKDLMLIQQSRYATMGEMLRNIAHQWRQPLNILALLLQDLKEAYEYGELTEIYLQKSIKKCLIQIQHMSCTINDFRDFFKPHKEASSFRPFQVIRQALKIISASLDHYDIQVKIQNQTKAYIYGYPNELSQVLINLLTNAREEFVRRQIEERSIWIRTFADEDFVYIEIKDNAGGIDESIYPYLFKPYVTTKKEGTGLGLYMAKMIITKMGGDLSAHSEKNGATFTICLPRKKEGRGL
ncbi:GAF domain-containing protein [Anoxybacillus vitaminiphilus]|uniref:histidine kinase n=1 Tax=Paranoxybacillus vitaminiphilus TaxID=581036 RepID=A0A327Y0W1_9BACL|nr:GAF domain-containing sensor histidine kinase [Anoxybacillus vitaminiphilus]RAK14858.1 GAF domain-containing protein [Anoxybacillus vitaminiphilus]